VERGVFGWPGMLHGGSGTLMLHGPPHQRAWIRGPIENACGQTEDTRQYVTENRTGVEMAIEERSMLAKAILLPVVPHEKRAAREMSSQEVGGYAPGHMRLPPPRSWIELNAAAAGREGV
jgi:hypothetical protein